MSSLNQHTPKPILPPAVLEAIIANTADAVLALDPKGHILILNKEAEKIYGTSRQVAVGNLFAEVGLLQEKLDNINDIIINAIMQPDKLINKDVSITFAENNEKHFQVRTRLLLDDHHACLGLIVIISDITDRIEATHERAESGMFLFMIILSLLVAMSVNGLVLKDNPEIDVYSDRFAWVYTVVILLPVLGYILWMKKPLSTFGLTLNNWRKSLNEGLIASAVFFFVGFAILVGISLSNDKSLVSFINFDMLTPPKLAYTVHSFIQELVFRGIILAALLSLFRDYSQWFALFISALLFGFIHTHLGISAIIMTFLMGLFFGWMYLRHQNLIGVTVVHIILGLSAFFFGIL